MATGLGLPASLDDDALNSTTCYMAQRAATPVARPKTPVDQPQEQHYLLQLSCGHVEDKAMFAVEPTSLWCSICEEEADVIEVRGCN